MSRYFIACCPLHCQSGTTQDWALTKHPYGHMTSWSYMSPHSHIWNFIVHLEWLHWLLPGNLSQIVLCFDNELPLPQSLIQSQSAPGFHSCLFGVYFPRWHLQWIPLSMHAYTFPFPGLISRHQAQQGPLLLKHLGSLNYFSSTSYSSASFKNLLPFLKSKSNFIKNLKNRTNKI